MLFVCKVGNYLNVIRSTRRLGENKLLCTILRGKTAMHFFLFPVAYIIKYHGTLIGVEAAKRDLAHIFSSFQIISYSKRHLCPLQLFSYALELACPSWSYMQGPEILITGTFLLRACSLSLGVRNVS